MGGMGCPMGGMGCPRGGNGCPAGGGTFIPMEGSGPLRGPPMGVTLPGRGPITPGLNCSILPVILCPSDPGGGDIGLFSAIGERGDLKGCTAKRGETKIFRLSDVVTIFHCMHYMYIQNGLTGNDLPMGGSPSPTLGGTGVFTFMVGGRGLMRGGSIGRLVLGPGVGGGMEVIGRGDMGAIRPPPGLGNDMLLFSEDPRSVVIWGFSGGNDEPIPFFIRPPPTVSSPEKSEHCVLTLTFDYSLYVCASVHVCSDCTCTRDRCMHGCG